MKILAAGDLHGDQRQAQRLAEKAEKEEVDLVILSGDLTIGESFMGGLIGPFKSKEKEVVLIPGNHESVATADFLASLYNAKNLHGSSISTEEVGIFGCGSANIGIFQLPEKEIYGLLKTGFEEVKSKNKKIMVTHVHPDKTLMEKLTNVFPGSSAVSRAIRKFRPNVAICSHVHEAAGIEEQIGNTRLVNVGKSGKIIQI